MLPLKRHDFGQNIVSAGKNNTANTEEFLNRMRKESGVRKSSVERGRRRNRAITRTSKFKDVPTKCYGIMRDWNKQSRVTRAAKRLTPYYWKEVRPCKKKYRKTMKN